MPAADATMEAEARAWLTAVLGDEALGDGTLQMELRSGVRRPRALQP